MWCFSSRKRRPPPPSTFAEMAMTARLPDIFPPDGGAVVFKRGTDLSDLWESAAFQAEKGAPKGSYKLLAGQDLVASRIGNKIYVMPADPATTIAELFVFAFEQKTAPVNHSIFPAAGFMIIVSTRVGAFSDNGYAHNL